MTETKIISLRELYKAYERNDSSLADEFEKLGIEKHIEIIYSGNEINKSGR
jgi:hypothetical protein